MEFETLLAKLLRLPIEKGTKIFDPILKESGLYFGQLNAAGNLLMEKTLTSKRIKEECFTEVMVALGFMCRSKNAIADMALDEVKSYPMIIWMETIGALNDEEIKNVLKNYSDKLPPSLIETLILNLSESKQAVAINKYKSRLDPKGQLFDSFYFCLGEDARKEIDKHFPKAVNVNPLLKLQDLHPEDYKDEMINNFEKFNEIPMDRIVEDILLKLDDSQRIFDILDAYKDRHTEISDMKFKLLVGRLTDLLRNKSGNYDEDENCLLVFNKLKQSFKTLGLKETLTLLNAEPPGYYYRSNRGISIIYDLLDIAYEKEELEKFVNDRTKTALIEKFVNNCNNKTYTLEDFEKLVEKTTTEKPHKLIRDDYIEAMLACRQLMQNKTISDTDEHFLLLRSRFINMLNDSVIKDGTCTEDVNFNGLFYRLIKGGVSFDKVFNTKTYKGLIYLTKAGQVYNEPDYITTNLTDEQIRKLDITPLLGLKKELIKEAKRKFEENKPVNYETDFDYDEDDEFDLFRIPNTPREFDPSTAISYIKERMMLQLLCCFGENRARHIIKSGMKPNRIEHVFDGIDYKTIEIDENGKPILNEELMDFLFGRGSVVEKNSVINKIIREELMSFESYVSEIYNNYEEIKKACHGVITVKRATAHFENVELPVSLKPNQYNYKAALKEMKTTEEKLLEKGISLCDDAKKREYSTIPKVKNKLGDFTYEILDVKDPKALIVGYLSHCCFVVGGISRDALDHAMQSKNGRVLVVYYKGNFLAQSWLWRNGDVVCCDSVETGSSTHGAYHDDINLVDVYKDVANQIMNISANNESKEERVKVVTLGASDYIFDDLKPVIGEVPRPLEKKVYVYDSNHQKVLAGAMPEKPRYGEVFARYKDPRKRVHKFLDMDDADIDDLDEALLKLQSIKYDATGSEEVENITEVNQLFVGQDWYIQANKDGEVHAEIVGTDERAIEECKQYAQILGVTIEEHYDELNDRSTITKDEVVKQLRKTKIESRRG